jgi:DNA-binding transcriptional ArsR family regulator
MNKILLLKEPGYIYDLNFIFCLKFNEKLYIEDLPKEYKKVLALEHFNDISTRFQEIPDDLYVFFHANDAGRAFLPTYYFNPYSQLFATTYNFKFLLNELSDNDRLIRNLIKFYFHDLDNEEIERCANSLQTIFSHIKNSDHTEGTKNKLYEFFIAPTRYIQLLQYELIQKEVLLSEYYKDNYQMIIDLYNQTSMELIIDQMEGLKDLTFLKNEQNWYVSYCLLNNYCINQFPFLDGFLSMFGYQYANILDLVKQKNTSPDLCSLGTALCEESRVNILNFLLKHGEITRKDLEIEFSFSGSTAYHHINIMVKSGIIKTRNKGKTILYSVNQGYIRSIIEIFNNFLKKKGS